MELNAHHRQELNAHQRQIAREFRQALPDILTGADWSCSGVPMRRGEINPTIGEILQAVADAAGLKKAALTGERRTRDISTAKHVAAYLCTELAQHADNKAIAKAIRRDVSYVRKYHKVTEGRLNSSTWANYGVLYRTAKTALGYPS